MIWRNRYCFQVLRSLATLLLLTLVSISSAQDPFEQMRDLLQRGYYNSAARVVGLDLIENHPQSAEAHFLFSRALYLIGDVEAARRQFDRAVALGGDATDPEYNHLAGTLRAAEGDLAGGAQLLRNAFLRSGRYEHAMDWGRVAWQAYDLEEALAAYEAAAETEEGRSSPWPHLNRGRLLMFSGLEQEAIAAYGKAIEVFEQFDTGEARPSPAYVEAYFRLGEIYESLAEDDSEEQARYLQLAADHYRAALTGDPNYAPAIEALDSLSRRLP